MSKVLNREAEDMAELSKACTIPAESPVPSPVLISDGSLLPIPNSRESDALFWLLWILYPRVQHGQIYSHIIKSKIEIFKT